MEADKPLNRRLGVALIVLLTILALGLCVFANDSAIWIMAALEIIFWLGILWLFNTRPVKF